MSDSVRLPGTACVAPLRLRFSTPSRAARVIRPLPPYAPRRTTRRRWRIRATWAAAWRQLPAWHATARLTTAARTRAARLRGSGPRSPKRSHETADTAATRQGFGAGIPAPRQKPRTTTADRIGWRALRRASRPPTQTARLTTAARTRAEPPARIGTVFADPLGRSAPSLHAQQHGATAPAEGHPAHKGRLPASLSGRADRQPEAAWSHQAAAKAAKGGTRNRPATGTAHTTRPSPRRP